MLKYVIFGIVLYIGIVLSGSYSIEADELKDYLRTFINQSCCYTNDCCWSISESELTDLGNGKYKINATGQIIAKTGDSPDGKFWRCACDLVGYDWIKSNLSNTRCLYVPFQGS